MRSGRSRGTVSGMGCVGLSSLPPLALLLPREAVRGVVTVLPLAIEIE
eukprot:COSAG06_NODE_3015_length_5959_cov_59.427645_3_plen_48_part_00